MRKRPNPLHTGALLLLAALTLPCFHAQARSAAPQAVQSQEAAAGDNKKLSEAAAELLKDTSRRGEARHLLHCPTLTKTE